MAKTTYIYPIQQIHGKIRKDQGVSFRVTRGVLHTYSFQNPHQGPASPAQNAMRQALAAAGKYVSILFRDPAVKAEWTQRCKATAYSRPDRYCVAEYYRLFKSDPEQLQAALAVIEEDKKSKQ